MSEVEKMYRTIFGEFLSNCSLCAELLDCKIVNYIYYCDKFKWDYKRLFTTEKQLEITKFIGLHYGFQMLENEAFDYMIATRLYVKFEHEYKGYGYSYNEAIANLVNNLWQDLTEEERKQIKEILSE